MIAVSDFYVENLTFCLPVQLKKAMVSEILFILLNVHFIVLAEYIFKTWFPVAPSHIYVLKIFIGFVIFNFTLFY